MRFRAPFDDVQYAAALETHRRMRANLNQLRRKFPPTTFTTARLLKRYRELIQEFARQLGVPRGKINPRRLNELSDQMVKTFVDYVEARND